MAGAAQLVQLLAGGGCQISNRAFCFQRSAACSGVSVSAARAVTDLASHSGFGYVYLVPFGCRYRPRRVTLEAARDGESRSARRQGLTDRGVQRV